MATPPRTASAASPSVRGWFFAASSTLLACACGFLGVAFNLEHSSLGLKEQIRAAISSQDFSRAKGLIGELSVGRPLEWFIAGHAELSRRKLRNGVALELIAIAEQTKNPKLGSFTSSVERAKRSIVPLTEDNSDLSAAWERALTPMSERVASLAKEDNLHRQRAALEDTCTESHAAFEAQADRFAKLLGLHYEREADCKHSGTYSAGALAGLPIIPKIPDDLPDLSAARDAMEAAGGRVSVEGNNAQEEFSAEIDSIKTSAAAAQEENRKAVLQLDLIQRELDGTDGENSDLSNSIRLHLAETIRLLM